MIGLKTLQMLVKYFISDISPDHFSLKSFFLKIYFKLCVCVFMCGDVSECWCQRRSEIHSELLHTGGSELPDVGAGNLTQVLSREVSTANY